jgi:predicted aspartyl protease
MMLALLLAAVPLRIVQHAPVADQVYVNGEGPFRFLIDTGSDSTALDARLAAKLGVRPVFRTRVKTLAGMGWRAGGRLTRLELGPLSAEDLEVFFDPLEAVHALDSELHGVLGTDFLSRSDFLVDYRAKRLVLGAGAWRGERVPLHWVEGRPAVDAWCGGLALRLVLDSGVGRLVLFRRGASRAEAEVATGAGKRRASLGEVAELRIGGSAWKRVEAVLAEVPGREAGGLLPLRMFGAVFISKHGGYVIFDPHGAKAR